MLASLLCQAGPVSYYGALTTSGNKIRGNGMDVQLKGPSFFGQMAASLAFTMQILWTGLWTQWMFPLSAMP